MSDNLNPQQFGTHMWHVAPIAVRNNIEKHGLKPGESGAVWGFTDRGSVGEINPEHHDVWRANIVQQRGLTHGSDASSEWYEDDPVVATSSRIHPGRLRRE